MSAPILVTGGNKGLGLAIVRALLVTGDPDTVVLLGSRDLKRGEAAVQALQAEIGCSGRLYPLQLDVTSQESIKAAVEWVRHQFGSLAGIVNNAGTTFTPTAREVFDVNLYGAINVTEAFLSMLPDGGRVVMISSFGAQAHVEKCTVAEQQLLSDPATPWSEVEKRLVLPFLNITDRTDLDSLAKRDAIRKMELMPPNPEPPIMSGNQQVAGWEEYVYGAYSISKVALNCYMLDLAKKQPQLGVNCYEPGVFRSDLSASTLKKIGLNYEDFKDQLGTTDGPSAVVASLILKPTDTGHLYGSDGLKSPLFRMRTPGQPEYAGERPGTA